MLILTSFSCAQNKIDPFERTTGLTRSEIEDTMLKNSKADKLKKAEEKKVEAPIPTISKLIITPPPPTIGGNQTISFSVTDQVPLKDVLIELGRVAKIDVDLGPGISGGVTINAKNRPLKEVLDRIATLGQLRYSYKNGVLYFERDTPYMKNYFVDYLVDGLLWPDVESNITSLLALGTTSSSSDSILSEESTNISASTSSSSSSFSSNKSAGIISLFATGKQHEEIAKYLADVDKYASAQVLIEAKVVEVRLSDTFKSGIDWSSVGKKTNTTGATGFVAGSTGAAAISLVTTELFNSDLGATIGLLEKFGTTKTISSPRIHAINNQKATLNFSDKLVYFSVVNTTTQTTGQSGNVVTNSTSTKIEESVGVELSITPSINLKTNEIIMNISPKLSVKSDEVTDPVNTSNKVPIIQSRELSTVAKIQSGNVVIIGGLMKEEATNTDSGIPLLNRIPILGWLFKSVSKVSSVTETVIFIKATVITSGTAVSKEDRNFQENFDPSKRRYFTN